MPIHTSPVSLIIMNDSPTPTVPATQPNSNSKNKKAKWVLTWLILVALVLGAILGHFLHRYHTDSQLETLLTQIANDTPLTITTLNNYDIDAIKTYTPQQAKAELDKLNSDHQFYESWRAGLWFVGNDIFIKMLKMLIMPLIISSVIIGVASIGDVSKLGFVGGSTVIYYFITMLIAVSIGLTLVTFVNPGQYMTKHDVAQAEKDYQQDTAVQTKIEKAPKGFGQALLNIAKSIIPANPAAAIAQGKVLPTIFFCIFFAVILTTIGQKGLIVIQFFEAVFNIMMKMVHIIIWLTPFGVFSLLAWTIAAKGLGVFVSAISAYMLTVIGGLSIHAFIVLPLLLWIFAKTSPLKFMQAMRPALLTAFGTDSSSATLPVTIECCTEFGNCSKKASGFVLPLGATINMDGTALFESVAVVFIAQSYGANLGFPELVIIALTATLTAIGAAGIPSASLVLMPTVIIAVNQSLGYESLDMPGAIPIIGIGLILGVDRILDMCRTTVNVWGDAVGARIITRIAPDDL